MSSGPSARSQARSCPRLGRDQRTLLTAELAAASELRALETRAGRRRARGHRLRGERVRLARRALAVRDGRPVALAARRLQEARRGKAEHESAGRDRPRVAPSEVLDVAHELVAVGVLQPLPRALGLLGRLLRVAGGRVLALRAELLG